jgi:hypothetical protein
LGEQVQKEVVRLYSLAFGGFKETAQHAVVLQTARPSGAVDDFAHDDHRSQTAFGLIVGRSERDHPLGRVSTGKTLLSSIFFIEFSLGRQSLFLQAAFDPFISLA